LIHGQKGLNEIAFTNGHAGKLFEPVAMRDEGFSIPQAIASILTQVVGKKMRRGKGSIRITAPYFPLTWQNRRALMLGST
jgi:hypothetical protein